jgi:hypothetical protein
MSTHHHVCLYLFDGQTMEHLPPSVVLSITSRAQYPRMNATDEMNTTEVCACVRVCVCAYVHVCGPSTPSLVIMVSPLVPILGR